MSNNNLSHTGVLGMKWGRRRVDNTINRTIKKVDKQIVNNQLNKLTVHTLLKNKENGMGGKLDPETKKAFQHELKQAEKAITTWIQTKDGLMTMKASQLTTKPEVKKYFDSKIKEAGVYYPF